MVTARVGGASGPLPSGVPRQPLRKADRSRLRRLSPSPFARSPSSPLSPSPFARSPSSPPVPLSLRERGNDGPGSKPNADQSPHVGPIHPDRTLVIRPPSPRMRRGGQGVVRSRHPYQKHVSPPRPVHVRC